MHFLKTQTHKKAPIKTLKKTFSILIIFAFILALALPLVAATSIAIYRGNTNSKKMALTFDFGADGAGLSSILGTLASYNAKSTFFITGQAAANAPNAARQVLAGGHELGNHSYWHPDFTKISAATMRNELSRTKQLVESQTGQTMKPYFRPPYGASSQYVRQIAGEMGYTHTVFWDIDPRDWAGTSTNELINHVVSRAHNGGIVVLHVSASTNITRALPGMIQGLKNKGYELVTISNIMGNTSPSTPAPNPNPTPQPVPSGGTRYTVRAGDTLSRIAGAYGVSVSAIAQANNIANINLIYVGQSLLIPGSSSTPPPTPTPTPQPTPQPTPNPNPNPTPQPTPDPTPAPSTGTRYTVRAGDTLNRISATYGVSVSAIAQANRIANINLIYVGQVLTIPGTSSTPAPTPQPTPNPTPQPTPNPTPQPTPNPTPNPTPDPTPAPSTGTRYTVVVGDTLSRISARYGVTISAIASANRIANINLIYVGQVLVIP